MRKAVSAISTAGLALVLGAGGVLAQDTIRTVEVIQAPQKKISLFTAIDFGRVESGRDMYANSANGLEVEGAALNRTYVNVDYTEQVDEHFLVSVGVGGIFWRAFSPTGGGIDDKVIKFGPGISNAYMKWMPSDKVDLTFGFFSYKYNDAAQNLGEYLFRTEAYPTIVYTGGWSWINDARYSTLGVKLSASSLGGKLRHDVGLFGEYFNSPIYDLTPAYIATFKPTDWFTVGGAAAWHRAITPTPSTKRAVTAEYYYRSNFYLPAAPASGTNPARPARYVTMLEEDIRLGLEAEGLNFDTVANLPQNNGTDSQTVSFDLAAVKLVGFFEFNLNALTGLDVDRVGKFNVYGEVAQLGLKDYPVFYTEKSQRRPIMLGVSVPTFGLLNSLSVEGQYLDNPTIESIASTYDKLDLRPDENFRLRFNENFQRQPDPNFDYWAYNRDNIKWSVHASRKITDVLTLYAQVANDHMRLKNGFAQPQFIPVTNEPDHWYWLTRIQWAL